MQAGLAIARAQQQRLQADVPRHQSLHGLAMVALLVPSLACCCGCGSSYQAAGGHGTPPCGHGSPNLLGASTAHLCC